MNFLILLSILACAIIDLSSSQEQADGTIDIIRTGICYNQQPGSTFPDLNNCSQFMICMDRNGLILSRCPQHMPYFNHCLSRCVTNIGVCSVVYCYGTTTTDYPWSTTTTRTNPPWSTNTPYTTMGTTTEYPWFTTPGPYSKYR